MSTRFEAVVVAAPKSALIRFLETLPAMLREREVPEDPFAPFTLELYGVGRGRFVLFAWKEGASRPDAWQEIEDLADEISLVFDTAVAVHYDNMVGLRIGMLTREGEAERYYGDDDSVWVPYGADGQLVLDGPRYAGNAIPKGVECDCIWTGIDAALEAAGFRKWLTFEKLVSEVAYWDQPVWKRLGVKKRRTRGGEAEAAKSTRARTMRK